MGMKRPGEGIECCHPRCSAAPQKRYEFPVPLCARHIVQVLTAAGEVTSRARRDHMTETQAPLPVINQALRSAGHSKFAHDEIVYYIRFGDRVKIGTTTNLKSRLIHIPHDEVLGVEPGGFALERDRHAQFAKYRVAGEWFTLSAEILEHIKTLQHSASV